MAQQDHIRLQDRDIPFERARLQIDQLTLDPQNPRIQYLIGRRPDPVSQEELDELLWAKDQVKALGQSIKQNGGVYDPIVVQKLDGRYVVREGNSRTVAVRHIAEQHPGDNRFTTVPAMVFDEELTEDDLAVLLADMHVTGKIHWDAYEQAKHVSTLYNVHGKTYDWIATHLRLSKSKITQQLKAYGWTTDYLSENGDPRNIEKFSFFSELARKKDLATRYADDLAFQQQFKRWLTDGKLTDSKQVRQLGTILENDRAAKALEEEGWTPAASVLIREDPALGSDLYDAVKRATEKLNKAPLDEIQDLGNNKQKLLMLRGLHRAIEDLATQAEVSL
jgi:ParB-like nuclease family protein